jgi:hypothetical protein
MYNGKKKQIFFQLIFFSSYGHLIEGGRLGAEFNSILSGVTFSHGTWFDREKLSAQYLPSHIYVYR